MPMLVRSMEANNAHLPMLLTPLPIGRAGKVEARQKRLGSNVGHAVGNWDADNIATVECTACDVAHGMTVLLG